MSVASAREASKVQGGASKVQGSASAVVCASWHHSGLASPFSPQPFSRSPATALEGSATSAANP
eukprot:2323760-Rhodomonas_salina.2